MKSVAGCWLPDDDTHFGPVLLKSVREEGFPLYQESKRERSMQHVRRRRLAVDVGAHVGLWSRPLSKVFDRLVAFEPVAERCECWHRNMEGRGGTLHQAALDETTTLDSYVLADVDYLKVDCEGVELPVLRGARETLLRCKPVVCVEQKPGYAVRHGLPEIGAVEFLRELGAHLVENMSGVYLMRWED